MTGIYSPYNENTSNGRHHCDTFCKSSCHNPKLPIGLPHPLLYWAARYTYSIWGFKGLTICNDPAKSNLCSINLPKGRLKIRYRRELSYRHHWGERSSHGFPKTSVRRITRNLDIGIQILGTKAYETKVGLLRIKILCILCIWPKNLGKLCHNAKQTDHNLILLYCTVYKEKYV